MKILITGNGFDLYHNLPTSYNDMIEILSHVVDNKVELLDFEAIYSKSSQYSRGLKEKYQVFDFDKPKITELKDLLEQNVWFSYFRKELEIETWIDFEKKIEHVLDQSLTLIYELYKKNLFDKSSYSCEMRADSVTRIEFKDFGNKIVLTELLKDFRLIEENWNHEFTLNEEYLVKKHHYYIDVDFDKISEFLLDELGKFKLIFKLYFQNIVYPLLESVKTQGESDVFYGVDRHFTFNYTPTFQHFYRTKKDAEGKGKTRFLHGKIPLEGESNVVLGINEVPDVEINKTSIIPFTKYFQKLYNRCDIEFLTEFSEYQNREFEFFWFGHSLDFSDKYYIDEVFKFALNEENSNETKIYVFYHSDSSRGTLYTNLINIRGQEEIVRLSQINVLQFVQIDSKEFKELFKDSEYYMKFGRSNV
ncbi:AbiH family protein [Tenacibaculum xiamenense]|uniref:AbiH family protein n=1 Tax=Tenacibaculum xiamenense TaxID=1261553 RepID=UPI003892FEEF